MRSKVREIKMPKERKEWYLVLWLSLAYFQELYNFLGLKIMLGKSEVYTKDIQSWELSGMRFFLAIVIAWIFVKRLYVFQPKLVEIFKWAMAVQSITCISTALIIACSGDELENSPLLGVLKGVRFLWGIFLGLGLGISFSILSRSFSRRKRTFVGAFVVAAGLAGPLFIAAISEISIVETHKWIYALLPLLVMCFLIFHWKRLDIILGAFLTKAEIGNAMSCLIINDSIKRHLADRKFWRSFIWLLISGLNVQFCVNFLLADPSRFIPGGSGITYDKFELYRYAVYGRYIFFIAGVIIFGYLSILLKSRSKPFFITGIIGLFGMTLYINVLANWDNIETQPLFLILLSGIIGLSNSNWLITLLQGIEAYGKRLQAVILLILPTFYRLAAGALLNFDSDQMRQIQLLSFSWSFGGKMTPDQILYLGIGITILGFVAAFLWEENFEGSNNLKISDDNVDKNFSVAILDYQTRQDFRQRVSGIVWKSEDFSKLQQRVSDILNKRFRDVFEEWMYSFSIASTNLKNGQLVFGDAYVNNNAYRDLSHVRAEDAANYQLIADNLILGGQPIRSLTRYAIDNKLNGLVLASKKSLKQLDAEAYRDNDYQLFDLSDFHLPDDDTIGQFWKKEGNEQKKSFQIIAKQAGGRLDEKAESIRDALILRALDMWRYPLKQYFQYIITPQSAVESESQQRIALLLMTAIKIPVSKLDELAGMLTWLLAQRSLALTMDREWQKISEEQSHSMKTVFGNMRNDLYALNDYKNNENLFLDKWASLEANIIRLDRINQFTLALARAGDARALDEVDDKVKGIFIMEAIPLRNIVGETLIEIQRTLGNIGFSVDGHKDKVNALIPLLIKQVKEDIGPNVKVIAARTGLQIVLNDLLGNMLFYTNSGSPEARIALEETGDAYILKLTNNRRINENYRQLIVDSKDQPEIHIQRKAGIRMVKRIIGSPLFNQNSNKRWLLSLAPDNPDRESTTILLTIPKA